MFVMVMGSFPGMAHAVGEEEKLDYESIAKCCGLAIEHENGTGTAKCCGCTFSSWSLGDAALVAMAMSGLVMISKKQK